MTVKTDKTFIKITNQDIYNAIESFKISNRLEHDEIIAHLQETNGKVKANRLYVQGLWVAVGALTTGFIILVNYVLKI